MQVLLQAVAAFQQLLAFGTQGVVCRPQIAVLAMQGFKFATYARQFFLEQVAVLLEQQAVLFCQRHQAGGGMVQLDFQGALVLLGLGGQAREDMFRLA